MALRVADASGVPVFQWEALSPAGPGKAQRFKPSQREIRPRLRATRR